MVGKTCTGPGLRLALTLLLLAWPVKAPPARADEPAKEATDEERKKLATEMLPLHNQGSRMYSDGRYAEAAELWEQVLADARVLYPADRYPDGHANLVNSLNNLGSALRDGGQYARAEPYFREALEMRQRLYPADKFPDGRPDLADDLNNLGQVLQAQGKYGKAESYYRDALEMYRKLYPADKYPDGHDFLVRALSNLGSVLQDRGDFAGAEPYQRDALEMARRLYPADKYPDGNPFLAASLNNLAMLLQNRGEYARAEQYQRDALAMLRKAFPADKYPDGHPYLARCLNTLGFLLRAQGEYAKAEAYNREALEMRQRLYPADKYPDGHPDLADSLNNLGWLLQAQGKYGQAEERYRQAQEMYRKLYPGGHPTLASILGNRGGALEAQGEYGKADECYRAALEMARRLYPADRYPDGHPDLAHGLNGLGFLLLAQGEYGKAEPYFREALEMRRKLFPADQFPDGHPDLAGSLGNWGTVLRARGEYGKAADVLGEALAMYDRLTAAFSDAAAEAEALNLSASLPAARDLYLFAAARAEGADPADYYPRVWGGKAPLARALERRRRLLRAAAAADEDARRKLEKLMEVRQDLARLIVAPARPGNADRAQLLQDLTDRKERLEKDLARLLPASERETPRTADLADRLPDHAVFIDLYRYADLDMKSRKWDGGYYAAFVLRKGRPVRRVELGDAPPIDKDLKQWRQDIARGFGSDAAARLRTSVWEPIARALGDDVTTVYLCPDDRLSALPWAALPGDKPDRVLLEDYAFAVVPSGPFLLEQLSNPAPAGRDAGVLLAVGGVRYDRDGAPADKAGKPWPALPATDKERAAVVASAGKSAKTPAVVELSGAGADVGRLLKELPKARWAHLATHGFFAAEESQERAHLFRPGDFQFGVGLERRGAAERNPLTQSGLVLAGANQPDKDTAGVLSGEAIAGLDLDDMDLAVLSACQTGLGESDTGEGVFGLQRAFHTAGARNVVASLWTVDDESTAALMNLFYYHLWEKGEPPLEALHHAQLELYRSPQGIPALAKGRGAADWDETVQGVTKPPADPKESPRKPAAVRDWAAFVLSGAGR